MNNIMINVGIVSRLVFLLLPLVGITLWFTTTAVYAWHESYLVLDKYLDFYCLSASITTKPNATTQKKRVL